MTNSVLFHAVPRLSGLALYFLDWNMAHVILNVLMYFSVFYPFNVYIFVSLFLKVWHFLSYFHTKCFCFNVFSVVLFFVYFRVADFNSDKINSSISFILPN